MQREPNKIDQWLQYSPILYNHLIIGNAPMLEGINTAKWIKGFTNVKSSFKFEEGYACLVGPTERISKNGSKQGGLCIYRVLLPLEDELDDDRLAPTMKLRSSWYFEEEIDTFTQFANSLGDQTTNNMLAVAYKKRPIVHLFPTRKLLDEGHHEDYAEKMSSGKIEIHKDIITSIRWANVGSHKIFIASDDSTISCWDVEKLRMDRHLKYHKGSVKEICALFDFKREWGDGPMVTPDSPTAMASVSVDGTMLLWDHRSQTPVNKINPKQGELHSTDSISQNLILTGGIDGSIKLWDLRLQREHLYDSKLDRGHRHEGKVRQIVVNRYPHYLPEKYEKSTKNPIIGKIKFSSGGDDGKIIEWEEKFQFMHEGHESSVSFDLADINPLCLSAEKGKNIFMVWESGVQIGHQES